jgi:hypothetical protein
LDEINEIEPAKEGYGEDSFVKKIAFFEGGELN